MSALMRAAAPMANAAARRVAAPGASAAVRRVALAVGITAAPLCAHAQAAVAGARAQAADPGANAQAADPAAAPIAALNQGLANLEKTSAQSFAVRYAAMAPIVDRAFDLPAILKTIVGLRWGGIPAAQRQSLLGVFRAFTICNYVSNFNSDSGDTFRILPETRSVGTGRVIETEILPKSGDPVRMDYVMHQNSGTSWQATDVLETGTISQAAVQRSDFRSLLTGNDAQALIASLQKKVATLSGGAIKP
jgi:phospholipid transport system substrate-binding protein